MLIVMRPEATAREIAAVIAKIKALKLSPHVIPGKQRTAIGITGNKGSIDRDDFRLLKGVVDVIPVTKPYKLVSRETKAEDTIVKVGKLRIGDGSFCIMAGPCAVESESQIMAAAKVVKKSGAKIFRAGAYKPRSSPYSFQGLKEEGLKLLAKVRRETGLAIVSEVKDVETLPLLCEYVDILQIGARNMQNFSLLEACGKSKKPILLKRGLSATISEWLMSAEYILAQGNYQVILCERGIRTFETATRNTLDINAVPVIKKETHLPIILDPSHGFGIWYGVAPLACASAAVGADGLMVEMHPNPAEALSDGIQSLTPERFGDLVKDVRKVCRALGRSLQ